jgi:hypothetical protein
MNEPILAGAQAPGIVPPPPPPRRRSKWPLRLLVLLAVGIALVAVLALMVNAMHLSAPVHVVVDGQEVFNGFDVSSLPPAHKLVLAGAVMVALLAAMVIVPIALMLTLVAVLAVVLLIVGLPLAAVAIGLMLVLSPLILFGWLLWKLITS